MKLSITSVSLRADLEAALGAIAGAGFDAAHSLQEFGGLCAGGS